MHRYLARLYCYLVSEPEGPSLVLRPGTLKQGLTYLVQVTVSDPGECCVCMHCYLVCYLASEPEGRRWSCVLGPRNED